MMTLSEIHQLSAEHLAVMNDTDFELISEQGTDFRRALSDRVLHYLDIPEGWRACPEQTGEYGGVFPVNIRYRPDENGDKGLILHVCCPGDENPQWVVMRYCRKGEACCLYCADRFAPQSINHVLYTVAAEWGMCQWGAPEN